MDEADQQPLRHQSGLAGDHAHQECEIRAPPQDNAPRRRSRRRGVTSKRASSPRGKELDGADADRAGSRSLGRPLSKHFRHTYLPGVGVIPPPSYKRALCCPTISLASLLFFWGLVAFRTKGHSDWKCFHSGCKAVSEFIHFLEHPSV
jgi:hypothetical protein